MLFVFEQQRQKKSRAIQKSLSGGWGPSPPKKKIDRFYFNFVLNIFYRGGPFTEFPNFPWNRQLDQLAIQLFIQWGAGKLKIPAGDPSVFLWKHVAV